MSILLTLLRLDILAARSWFKTQTITKILVAAGFIITFAFVSWVIFVFSSIFFRNLSSYSEFGIITAEYLMNATILILFSFFVLTSAISALLFFTTQRKELSFLLPLPISPTLLVIWMFVRTSLIHMALFLFTMTPMVAAFAQIFSPENIAQVLFRFLIILCFLTVMTNALGTLLGYLTSPFFARKGILAGLFFLAVGVACFIGLLRIIFPPELRQLYNASPETFFSLYYSLPLVHTLSPTTWFVSWITTGGVVPFFLITCITGLTVFLSIGVQRITFLPLFQHLSYRYLSRKKEQSNSVFLTTRIPVFYKDLLSILRVPSEINYAIFLFLMNVFFFLFISTGQRFVENRATPLFTTFMMTTMLFFATAYTLRLVFPLMAREGKQRWFLFTLSRLRSDILFEKLILSLLLIVPHIILLVIWTIFQLKNSGLLFFLFTLISLFALTVTNGLLGAIQPNFPQGENPEKVSTSIMGLVSLFVSATISGIYSYLYFALQSTGSIEFWFFMLVLLFIPTLLSILLIVAHLHLPKYKG